MNKYNEVTLFTPGPVNVFPRVLSSGSRSMIHHRTPEFHDILENVITRMKCLFGTVEDVLLVHTTGRGAMEGTMRNLFSPGDKVLCVCNGKFGEMFAEISEICELKVQRVFKDWIEPIVLSQIDEALKKDPDIKGVTVVHNDTSTASINPISEIGALVRSHNRLFIVDCISSLGVMAFNCDEWKIDVAITASQKGLMAPAGISFVAINERAWREASKATRPGFYINFKNIKKYFDEKKETPGSTPVSLVTSVNESLNMIFEEGLENVYERHAFIARLIQNSLDAMGLSLLPARKDLRSHGITLFKTPEGIDPATIKKIARETYGIFIASGLGKLKKTALRIGHLGTPTIREALLVISVLEMTLFELGYLNRPGKGLEAFAANLDMSE